jgi:hypothetical protein
MSAALVEDVQQGDRSLYYALRGPVRVTTTTLENIEAVPESGHVDA